MREPTRVEDVDLYDPATQQDWYPTYDLLRAQAPVYRVPDTRMFVVTRYRDVVEVLRRTDLFATGTPMFRHDAARRVFAERGWPRATPLSTNPPEHRHYRDLVDRFFDASGAARWTSLIEGTLAECLDPMVPRGHGELVGDLALPLPVAVITRILGFAVEDTDRLKRWSEAWVMPFAGGLTEEQEVWVAEEGVAFQHHIHEVATAKRAEPGDDVISALVHARLDGERSLTDGEIVSIVDHLFIGGNETTTFALTSAVWILLREPGLYRRVLEDRSLMPRLVEEALRLESPTQGLFRVVTRDTELGGVALRAGSVVHVRYGAANRDPETFADPACVDLGRDNASRHLAFSLGEHHCPGAGLSRLEQRLALDAILDRLPDLRLAPGQDLSHEPGFVLRALGALHLEFSPDTRQAGHPPG